MSTYTILSYPNNLWTKKVFVAAEYGGIADKISYPSDFNMGVSNKTEEFLKISPLGQVPCLKIDGTDTGIFESNAIAKFIARVGNDKEGLIGADDVQMSLVDAWIEFNTNILTKDIFDLFAFKMGYGQFNKEKFDKALESQTKGWSILEGHLNRHGNKFLVGDRVTLADIIIGFSCSMTVTHALDSEFRSKYPRTVEYCKNLFEQEHFKKHITATFLDKFEPPK
ncbi:elongation factor 1-gamma [Acrasis kona]|uniref:Elongation factor 1-gamma n=1 Tax=Acrasis kona TaxID=1008807 RepID=A0AAW2ZS84_9EUKA